MEAWQHGTITGYSHHGCTCEPCLSEWARHQRAYVDAHPEQAEKRRERARRSYWRRKAQEVGMADKQYVIVRTARGVTCDVVPDKTKPGIGYRLAHVVVHSPTGFEFGYGGSGPADLALSIAADVLGEDPRAVKRYGHSGVGESKAWRVHQDVKFHFIGGLDRSVQRHVLDAGEIRQFIDAKLASDREIAL